MLNRKNSVTRNKSSSPFSRSLSSRKLSKPQINRKTASPRPIQEQSKRQNSISRQKLAQTLQTYTMLIRTNNPIRCLVHNCNISMYCQTEQKLLCANCIFGRTEHKFHRVTPVDKSLDRIQKDVETMNRLIDRELQSIKVTAEILRNNLSQDQNDAHTGLASLVKIYEECHQLLEESFLKAKSKILNKFESSRSHFEKIAFDLNLLFEDYGTHNILNNVNKQAFKKDELLLYQHSVSSAISSQKKFSQKDYISDRRQIQLSTAEEKKKIFGVLDLLRKINSK